MRAAIALLVSIAVVAQPPSAQQLDNLSALARLYGVVRYFYPSDAAADLDWERFAMLAVNRVRQAPDNAGLARVLQDLFAPLGPGLEIAATLPPAPPTGAPDPALVAWRYLGPGIATRTGYSPYDTKRTNRLTAPASASEEFVTMMQNVQAADLRGKRIRLRGRARVANPSSGAWAGLWLRVDRGERGMGFFDNMQDRPVRDSEWREHVIEGSVAEDATNVAFGVLAAGAISADFDAINLEVRQKAADQWTSVPLADGGFEAASGGPADTWLRAGSSRDAVITRSAEGAAEGDRFLRLVGVSRQARRFDAEDPVSGTHVDVDLVRGLTARVTLVLSDGDAKSETAALARLRAAVAESDHPTARFDLDARLVDVLIAWNVFRHFYPYWTETAVNWDTRLRVHLAAAHDASTREAHTRVLQRLVADARDGHGSVNEPGVRQRAVLPIQLRVVEGRLTITATETPADAPIGAIVRAIDGAPAADRLAEQVRLASGTEWWRTWRAVQQIASCVPGSTTRLTIEPAAAAAREVVLACNGPRPPAERRPDRIAQLKSGIWYVDLTRASFTEVEQRLTELSGATGIIFDVRGYPTDAGAKILPHLIAEPETDRWMHIAKITGPFGRLSGWHSVGWDIRPAAPHIAGKRVFLTDGRAISYAESVMGYVADRELGTIIGSATAGTNGNVAVVALPSGVTIAFTGMRVTGHDGATPHHLVGIRPDIPLEPTLAGIRAGRDELLEHALALLRTGR